ncbi:ImmA/IrrE family metallo-endopeptidase [Methyloversatilis sp.]|uniref:ImmA/IrrE family metallo-endopeptidase n=1 Tax=Methyloversatilis sp. TaxID=2569862 RepID=UPI0035AE96A8
MIGEGPLGGFRVAPRGIDIIRQGALNVADVLGVNGRPQDIQFGLLLDRLSLCGLTYDVVESSDLPHQDVEACWDPGSVTMYIRNDVYDGLCSDEPRARFTVVHELGHALLGHQRGINRAPLNRPLKCYEDSEWQANQFAAEFLMPLPQIQSLGLNNARAIGLHFNVSHQAATKRVSQLGKHGLLPC